MGMGCGGLLLVGRTDHRYLINVMVPSWHRGKGLMKASQKQCIRET
ncbi:hypothetical protein BCEP4_610033 [Burkholderia cepacia]|nr:hypothetical protein BCEP4_610033 [Burkholderia cepacia]